MLEEKDKTCRPPPPLPAPRHPLPWTARTASLAEMDAQPSRGVRRPVGAQRVGTARGRGGEGGRESEVRLGLCVGVWRAGSLEKRVRVSS